ncbi:porin [Moraxellaceae bacterium AER2_44_116]|nr:porin [Moraxellaceae bacterium]TQC99900.1 porin [Moraxellaceae bacterium AER2_44_116]
MKHNLIALAVAAAVTLPLTAQAAPKVYGQINISAEAYEKDFDGSAKDEEYTRMQSNASRFGVKGEDELTATLSAIYSIEWEVSAEGDDITKGTNANLDLVQRNRFVGIKHQELGTIKMGKYDTYLKLAQGKVDLFNDYAADMQFTIAGENRVNNVVGYESPKFMNTQVSVMSQTQDVAKGSKAGSSVSIVHHNEDMGLYLALASDMGINSKAALFADRESDSMRLVASYKIADLTLNCLYSTSENITGKDAETAYLLGAAYKLSDIVLKAQYSMAEADDTATIGATGSVEKAQMSIGADYNFTSKTKAFAWYTTKEDTKKAAVNNIDETVLALGVEHKF